MSENVEIAYDKPGDQAVLLLAAAEELGLDPSVIGTTSVGFMVPAEVAKKAGLVEEDKSEKPPAKKAAAKKSEAKE